MKPVSFSIIIITSILLFPFCGKKKTVCHDFKEGKFLIINNNQVTISEITRKKDLQLEKDMETGLIDSVKIEWLNNCTFTLQYFNQPGTSPITVEITNIEENTADIRANYPGVVTRPVLKMKKVE